MPGSAGAFSPAGAVAERLEATLTGPPSIYLEDEGSIKGKKCKGYTGFEVYMLEYENCNRVSGIEGFQNIFAFEGVSSTRITALRGLQVFRRVFQSSQEMYCL